MKQATGNLALFFICLGMFTSESVWYVPCGFVAIGITLLYVEARMRR